MTDPEQYRNRKLRRLNHLADQSGERLIPAPLFPNIPLFQRRYSAAQTLAEVAPSFRENYAPLDPNAS